MPNKMSTLVASATLVAQLEPMSQDPQPPKTLVIDGYSFSRKHIMKHHILYKCKYNRAKSPCTMKCKVMSDGTHVFQVLHGPDCAFILDVDKKRKWEDNNVTTEMRKAIIDIAISQLEMRPRDIWLKVAEDINRNHDSWKGLTDLKVINLVNNTRTETFGSNIFRTIEKPGISKVKESDD